MLARNFNNWIDEYVQFVSHLESPTSFQRLAALWAISAVMGRKCFLPMGSFEWTPNIFVLFVAKPGVVAKSTTISPAATMLKALKVPLGPSAVTFPALVKEMSKVKSTCALEGDDKYAHTSMALAVSELGTFLKTDDPDMVSGMIDLWDSFRGPWDKATMKWGRVSLDTPCLSFIGGTTPAWIKDNVTQTMLNGGLLSRFIIQYESEKRHLVAYPQPLDKEKQKKLFDDLFAISRLTGPFRMSSAAMEWGIAWYNEIHQPSLNNEAILGRLARYQTHAHKLAMLFSAAESNKRIIEVQHLQQAVDLIKETDRAIPFLMAQTATKGDQSVNTLLVILAERPGLTHEHLLRFALQRGVSYLNFSKALEGARTANLVIRKGLHYYIKPAE